MELNSCVTAGLGSEPQGYWGQTDNPGARGRGVAFWGSPSPTGCCAPFPKPVAAAPRWRAGGPGGQRRAGAGRPWLRLPARRGAPQRLSVSLGDCRALGTGRAEPGFPACARPYLISRRTVFCCGAARRLARPAALGGGSKANLTPRSRGSRGGGIRGGPWGRALGRPAPAPRPFAPCPTH